MGTRLLPGDSGGGCQGEGAGLCAFLALLENRSKPRRRRMPSLTMAVPTEKAAIRQAMPRGRRARAAAAAGTGGGHEAALAPGWAAAPRAGSGFCCSWGSGPARRAGPAHAPPTPRDWPARGAGRGRQVRVLLFCSCGGRRARRLKSPALPRAPRPAPPPGRHRGPSPAFVPPQPRSPRGPETRGGWAGGPGRPTDGRDLPPGPPPPSLRGYVDGARGGVGKEGRGTGRLFCFHC